MESLVKTGASGFWRARAVFVTGATGLLGSWLVKRLRADGAQVVCLVRDWIPESELVRSECIRNVITVRGDLTDRDLLERVLGEYEVETVFHLGAQTVVGVANRNPISTFESNIAGTWQLMEACRRSPKVRQIVIASSDKAYGWQKTLPYAEDNPLQGRHPYDVSKSCADLIAQSYATTYSLPVTITRCGNLYGGGDLNWNRIVPGTIRSMLLEERPVIRSDGRFVRDYFYVEDAVAAYLRLAEHMAAGTVAPGEAFNLSNESPVSVLALVQMILSIHGAALEPIILNEAAHEIREQYLCAGKARQQLNWKPAFTLEEGLLRTIRWYSEFLGAESIDALATDIAHR